MKKINFNKINFKKINFNKINFKKINLKKTFILTGIIFAVLLIVLSIIKIVNHNDKKILMSELTGKIWRNIDYKDYEERYIFYEDRTYVEGNFLNSDYFDETEYKDGKFKIKEDLFGNLKIVLIPKNSKYYKPEGYIEFDNNAISKLKISYYFFEPMTKAQLDKEKELELAEKKKKDEEMAEKEKIKVLDVNCYSSGSGNSYFTTISGKIHNTNRNNYSKVVLDISMYDSSGKYINRTTETLNGNISADSVTDFLRATQTTTKITKTVITVKEIVRSKSIQVVNPNANNSTVQSSTTNNSSSSDVQSSTTNNSSSSDVQSSTTNNFSSSDVQSSITDNSSSEQHIHNFSIKATCEEPAKCSCGETSGLAIDHNWEDATCEKAKTCNVCSKSEGEALGHTFEEEHPFYCSTCEKENPDALSILNKTNVVSVDSKVAVKNYSFSNFRLQGISTPFGKQGYSFEMEYEIECLSDFGTYQMNIVAYDANNSILSESYVMYNHYGGTLVSGESEKSYKSFIIYSDTPVVRIEIG